MPDDGGLTSAKENLRKMTENMQARYVQRLCAVLP